MLKILSPNTGEDIVPVIINHIFVYVTDYGLKAMLKEIIVSQGQHHWGWISFNPNKPIDLIGIGNKFSSFNNALNREVNNSYSTVYEFEDFNEMNLEWDKIKYVDGIRTVYKSDGYEQEVPDGA